MARWVSELKVDEQFAVPLDGAAQVREHHGTDCDAGGSLLTLRLHAVEIRKAAVLSRDVHGVVISAEAGGLRPHRYHHRQMLQLLPRDALQAGYKGADRQHELVRWPLRLHKV